MYSQVRFPQTLPTALALGALIFMVSVVLIVLAMWLRRLGTQPMKNT
jgi:ABC-type spermidine/putrescine transport system permease subunit II